MTIWDWASVLIVVPCLCFAFTPYRWRFWERKKADSPRTRIKPKIDPKSGWNGNYHGLFLENVGEVKAYNITIEPLQMGNYFTELIGPEVSQLDPGDTCFFHPNSAPPVLLLNSPSSTAIFNMLRSWQKEIEDFGAKAQGRISYKDRDGEDHETRYMVGVDVLNRSDGLVVEVVTEI